MYIQPRRIAAITVAERVAYEHGEQVRHSGSIHYLKKCEIRAYICYVYLCI